MIKGKFVKEIRVIDPDSKAPVHMAVYKLETGWMFAIESSFLETEEPVYSPLDKDIEIDPETFDTP